MTARTFNFSVVAQPQVSWTLPTPGQVISFPTSQLSTNAALQPAFTGRQGTIRGLYTETTCAFADGLGSAMGSVIAHGGGHNNYNGNEIYRWDVTTAAWSRIKDAHQPIRSRGYPFRTITAIETGLTSADSGVPSTRVTYGSSALNMNPLYGDTTSGSNTVILMGMTGGLAALNNRTGTLLRITNSGMTYEVAIDSSGLVNDYAGGGTIGANGGSETDHTYGEFIAETGVGTAVAKGSNGPGYQPGSTHTYDTLKVIPAGVLTDGPALVRVTAASGFNNAIQYPWVHYIDLANPTLNGWQRYARTTWGDLSYGGLLYDPDANRLVAFNGEPDSVINVSTVNYSPIGDGAVSTFSTQSIGASYMFGEMHSEYWVDPNSGTRYYILVTGIRGDVGGDETRKVVLINADTFASKVVTQNLNGVLTANLGAQTSALALARNKRAFYFLRNAWNASDTGATGTVSLETSMYQEVYKLNIPADPWNGVWTWTVEPLTSKPIGWMTYQNPSGDGKGRLRYHETLGCLLWFPWPTRAVQAIGVQ